MHILDQIKWNCFTPTIQTHAIIRRRWDCWEKRDQAWEREIDAECDKTRIWVRKLQVCNRMWTNLTSVSKIHFFHFPSLTNGELLWQNEPSMFILALYCMTYSLYFYKSVKMDCIWWKMLSWELPLSLPWETLWHGLIDLDHETRGMKRIILDGPTISSGSFNLMPLIPWFVTHKLDDLF